MSIKLPSTSPLTTSKVLCALVCLTILPLPSQPAPKLMVEPIPRKAIRKPLNVVLILADDAGWGDISSYGATSLQTTAIDRLALDGLRFTDGHSAAATCTPSRYSLLTGEYAFRRPGTDILPGDAALVINSNRRTLAGMMQNAGYVTGAVGKWHLGLGASGGPDWNSKIIPGPESVGFNYSFIMAATGDRVPTVYVSNQRVVGLDPRDPIRVSYDKQIGVWPTGRERPDLLKMHPSHGHDMTIINGVSRIGFMTGGQSALWKDEEMADLFTRQAVSFIELHQRRPFFLYFATHDPHVPRLPHPRFAGKSGMGPRGDALLQLDWSVGEILDALDRLNLTNDTLVIFSSDNGPVIDDGYHDSAVERLGSHKPSGPWRGGKYSNFESGTRVPFIIRWPALIKPGVSGALVSQIDLYASLAALVGQRRAQNEAPDSHNLLPAFLGRSSFGRESLLEQGTVISLRHRNWKFIPPSSGPSIQANTNIELGNDPYGQLFDLAVDPGESRNLIRLNPSQAAKMLKHLQQIRDPGRTTPRPRDSSR